MNIHRRLGVWGPNRQQNKLNRVDFVWTQKEFITIENGITLLKKLVLFIVDYILLGQPWLFNHAWNTPSSSKVFKKGFYEC